MAQIQLPRRGALEAPGQFSNEDADACPPIVERNHRPLETGTDIPGYLTESRSDLVQDRREGCRALDDVRGLEFVMTYYPILDHAPKGQERG